LCGGSLRDPMGRGGVGDRDRRRTGGQPSRQRIVALEQEFLAFRGLLTAIQRPSTGDQDRGVAVGARWLGRRRLCRQDRRRKQ
jgi:hypothetical protein